MEPRPGSVEILLERLRFVRGLRRLVEDEMDREEHTVLGLLREAGVTWRELGREYGKSLNAVAQHYDRLGTRVAGPSPRTRWARRR